MGWLWKFSWYWAWSTLLSFAFCDGMSLSLSNAKSSFRFLAEVTKACVEKQEEILWCNVTIDLYNKTQEFQRGLNLCMENPAVRMRFGYRDPSFLIHNITIDGVPVPRPDGGEYFMGDAFGVLEFHMRKLLINTGVCKKEKHMLVVLGIESTKHAAEALTVEFNAWDGPLEGYTEAALDNSDGPDEPGSPSTSIDGTINFEGRTEVMLATDRASIVGGAPWESPLGISEWEMTRASDIGSDGSGFMTELTVEPQLMNAKSDAEGPSREKETSNATIGRVSGGGTVPLTARFNPLDDEKKETSYNLNELYTITGASPKTQALRRRRISSSAVSGIKSSSEELLIEERTVPEKLPRSVDSRATSEQRNENKGFTESPTLTANGGINALGEETNVGHTHPGSSNDGKMTPLGSSRETNQDTHTIFDGLRSSSPGLSANHLVQTKLTTGEDASFTTRKITQSSGVLNSSKAAKIPDVMEEESLDLSSRGLVYDVVWRIKGCSEVDISANKVCVINAALPAAVNLCSTQRVSRLSIEAPGKTVKIVGLTIDGVDVLAGLMGVEIWGNEFYWSQLLVRSKVCAQAAHQKVRLVLRCTPDDCGDAAVVIRRMRSRLDSLAASLSSSTTTEAPLSATRHEETSRPALSEEPPIGSVTSSVLPLEEANLFLKTVAPPVIDALGVAVVAANRFLAKKDGTKMPVYRTGQDGIDDKPTASGMNGGALQRISTTRSGAGINSDPLILDIIAERTGCTTMSLDGSQCTVTFELENPVDLCAKDRITYLGIDYLVDQGEIKLQEMYVDDRKVRFSAKIFESLSKPIVNERSLVGLLNGTKVCTTKEHRKATFHLKCEENVCESAYIYISRARAQLAQRLRSSNAHGDQNFSLNASQESISSKDAASVEVLSRLEVYTPSAVEGPATTMTRTAGTLLSEIMTTERDSPSRAKGRSESEIQEKNVAMAFASEVGGGVDEPSRQRNQMSSIVLLGALALGGTPVLPSAAVRKRNGGEQLSIATVSDMARDAKRQPSVTMPVANRSEGSHFLHNISTTATSVVQVNLPPMSSTMETLKAENLTSNSSASELRYWIFKTSGVSLEGAGKTSPLLVERITGGRRFTVAETAYDWCNAELPSRLVFCQFGLRAKPEAVFFMSRDENVSESVQMTEIGVPDSVADADRCYALESCTSMWYGLQNVNCLKATMAIETRGDGTVESPEAILRVMPATGVPSLGLNVTQPVWLGPDDLAYVAPSVTCVSEDPEGVAAYKLWKRGDARFPTCTSEGKELLNYDAKHDKLLGTVYVAVERSTKRSGIADEGRGLPYLSCRSSKDGLNGTTLRATVCLVALALYLLKKDINFA